MSLNLNAVAAITGRAVSTVRADLYAGRLEATKGAGGRYDVSEEQLSAYMQYIRDKRKDTREDRRKRFEKYSRRVFRLDGIVGGAINRFKHAVLNTAPTLDATYTQWDNGKYTEVFRVKSWERDGILITTLYDEHGNVILTKETVNGAPK